MPPFRKPTKKQQREMIKLLIRFAWHNGGMEEFMRARALVVDLLELTDERPLDRRKRKAALNNFLADGGVQL